MVEVVLIVEKERNPRKEENLRKENLRKENLGEDNLNSNNS